MRHHAPTDLLSAVESTEPLLSLRALVGASLDTGQDREELLTQLQRLRITMAVRGDEASEDIVLEVMDYLTGFCSPAARL